MSRDGSVNTRPSDRAGGRASGGNGYAAIVQWRRIALDKQLPTARFPAGVRVPSLVCCCALVLVAVLCAVLFGATARPGAPQAVLDSQQQLVGGLARVLDNAFDATVDAVEDAADRYADDTARDADKLLAGLDDGVVRWAGSAVLDAKTRQPLAARGEPVPVAQVNPGGDRPAVKPLLQGNEPRVLVAVALADGRWLAGISVLRVRPLRLDPDQQQAVLVGLVAGEVRHVQGADPSGDGQVMAAVRRVVKATADGDPASRTAAPTGAAGGQPQNALVVVAAPVGDSGLAVASAVRTPVVAAGSRWLGVPPAVALLLATGVAFILLRMGVARPVRRLLELAKARACGDPRPARAPHFWLSETRRIAAALSDRAPHRAKAGGRKGRPRGVPAMVTVTAATAVVVLWSMATAVSFGAGARTVPAQVVKDTGNQIESVSIALGDVLDSGRAQLAAVAARAASISQGQLRSTLDRMAERDSRYRSLYVADASGRPALTVGRKPLRQERPLPGDSGVQLDNVSGRLPVIYSHTRLPDGRSLVAELDIGFLARLLERIDGHVRVVDPQLRTILDTEGYRAFQPMPEGASRAALTRPAAQTGANAGPARANVLAAGQTQADVLTASGLNPMLVATTPLATPSSTTHLKWTVVVERPVSDLRLPPNDLRRAALLVAGAAIVLALVSLGWHYFVLLRPLRKLAVAADRLARGNTEAVISPQRQDEIGAVAACLEIRRQVLVDGEWRLGGAARLRGGLDDFTTVMPIIGAPRKRQPALSKER